MMSLGRELFYSRNIRLTPAQKCRCHNNALQCRSFPFLSLNPFKPKFWGRSQKLNYGFVNDTCIKITRNSHFIIFISSSHHLAFHLLVLHLLPLIFFHLHSSCFFFFFLLRLVLFLLLLPTLKIVLFWKCKVYNKLRVLGAYNMLYISPSERFRHVWQFHHHRTFLINYMNILFSWKKTRAMLYGS